MLRRVVHHSLWQGMRRMKGGVRCLVAQPAPAVRMHGGTSPEASLEEFGAVDSLEVCSDGRAVVLGNVGGERVSLDAAWLWVNSSMHWDAATGQRVTPVGCTPDPMEVKVRSAVRKGDAVVVKWEYGAEKLGPQPESTVFSATWMAAHATRHVDGMYEEWARGGEVSLESPLRPGPNSARAWEYVPQMEWERVSGSEEGVLELCRGVATAGAVVVKGCGLEDGFVGKVASVIAPVQPTIYGELFDVVAEEDDAPINVAYSTAALEPHTDLCYYESPPGLQLLLCRRFDAGVVGGESTLVDGMAAAEVLRESDPWSFLVLCAVPATFQKVHYERQRPVHMVYHRPHIATAISGAAALALSSGGALHDAVRGLSMGRKPSEHEHDVALATAKSLGPVTGIFWAPPFEGPLQTTAQWTPAYLAAHASFNAHICGADPSFTAPARFRGSATVPWHEFRLEKGDCIVFNNRRMLHGRRLFNPSSSPPTPEEETQSQTSFRRHLQGCYVNIDEYASRLRHLEVTKGNGIPDTAYHVANQSAEGQR